MPPPDVTLEVDIEEFETDPSGAVVLVAKWLAHRERAGDQLRSSHIRLVTSSADTTGEVAAMSDAVGQLANEIALRIST
jgi:uncharacterized lipoprotein YmbA